MPDRYYLACTEDKKLYLCYGDINERNSTYSVELNEFGYDALISEIRKYLQCAVITGLRCQAALEFFPKFYPKKAGEHLTCLSICILLNQYHTIFICFLWNHNQKIDNCHGNRESGPKKNQI